MKIMWKLEHSTQHGGIARNGIISTSLPWFPKYLYYRYHFWINKVISKVNVDTEYMQNKGDLAFTHKTCIVIKWQIIGIGGNCRFWLWANSYWNRNPLRCRVITFVRCFFSMWTFKKRLWKLAFVLVYVMAWHFMNAFSWFNAFIFQIHWHSVTFGWKTIQ